MLEELRIPIHWEHREDGTWVAGIEVHTTYSPPYVIRPEDDEWWSLLPHGQRRPNLPRVSPLHIGWRGTDFVARDPESGAEEIVPLEAMLATVDDVVGGAEPLEPMHRELGERFGLNDAVIRELAKLEPELAKRAGELRQRAQIEAELDEAGDIILRRDGTELVRVPLTEWNYGVSPVNRLGRVLKAAGFELDLATRKRLVSELEGLERDPLEAARRRVRRAELELERARLELRELQPA